MSQNQQEALSIVRIEGKDLTEIEGILEAINKQRADAQAALNTVAREVEASDQELRNLLWARVSDMTGKDAKKNVLRLNKDFAKAGVIFISDFGPNEEAKAA